MGFADNLGVFSLGDPEGASPGTVCVPPPASWLAEGIGGLDRYAPRWGAPLGYCGETCVAAPRVGSGAQRSSEGRRQASAAGLWEKLNARGPFGSLRLRRGAALPQLHKGWMLEPGMEEEAAPQSLGTWEVLPSSDALPQALAQDGVFLGGGCSVSETPRYCVLCLLA